ncbi:MAG TPA: glycine cleavage system protein GcvH [Pirellulaceae bacterium]|nr:glycine cleavage system protein GcvH [Pirellulaceae bacterium]
MNQLLFAETHEWVHLKDDNGEKIATVGLTAHAIDQLGDLTFLESATEGTEVSAGEPFGEIESVKAASDMYSPVDGVIVEVNRDLTNKLELLNADPYGDAWIVKIRVTDETSIGKLLSYDAYQKQVVEHGGH